MPDDINREDLNDDFWGALEQEVHDAVKKNIDVITQGKNPKVLRYQQRVAEFKRLYYQWIFTWAIFFTSVTSALFLNKLFDLLTVPSGILFVILISILLLYKCVIKPRFDKCHAISLTLEREILKKEIENE